MSELITMANGCDPSTKEVETRGSYVRSQPDPHSKTLSYKPRADDVSQWRSAYFTDVKPWTQPSPSSYAKPQTVPCWIIL